MLFRIKEQNILILVEQFLKSQNYLNALRALEKESSVVLGSLTEDAAFLRDLVMEGEWDHVLEYLNPIREDSYYPQLRLMIEKQRYLELLATDKGSYDAAAVMKSLSILEEMTPTRHEYTALCYLLTRPHLKQHQQYEKWSHYESRLDCFNVIHTSLSHLINSEPPTSPSTGRLVDLLTKGLFYESALNLCSQKLAPGGCVNITDVLTDNLLQCQVEDKEAILLHWLYELPTSALVKPTNKKIVQVELEKTPPPRQITAQSVQFSRSRGLSRDQSRDMYSSIDRSAYPLPTTLLNDSIIKAPVEDTSNSTLISENTAENNAENVLGDSEVAMNQITSDDQILPPVPHTLTNPTTPTRPNLTTPAKPEEENLSASLLEIEMGFKNTQLVVTKEQDTTTEDPKTPMSSTAYFMHSPEHILAHAEEQEHKITLLQQQLNELRIQQDSLRMSAALERAGKVPSHPVLQEHRAHTKPLYEPPQYQVTSAILPESGGIKSMGFSSAFTHSALTDRGTSVTDKKDVTTAASNGWVDPGSLQTLESFSEDSLRPSKSSTPIKQARPASSKVADSSMLKVKFSPAAVLEDVQPIRCAAFHPSGELLAIGSNSKTLRVCSCHMLSDSVQTLIREDGCQDLPVLFKRNRHHRGSLYTVAWNTKGNLLATGSNDKTVMVVSFDADNCISVGVDREFSFHEGTVRDIHFSDERTMYSVGGGDNLLHVTDVEKGCEITAYSGHTDTVHCVRSYKDTIITGSSDATIRLWDRRTSTCTRVIGAALGTQGTSGVMSVSLNNFGNLLCASRDDGLCMLYDIEMCNLLAAFSPHTTATCRAVQFYRNPRYIISGSFDGSVALTCVEQVLLNPDVPCTEVLGTHRDKVTSVLWHPTKQAFATCSADRTACLWTAKEGIPD